MIYVDTYNAKFGNMIMCHLFADTNEELMQMVEKINVNKKWIQKKDKPEEHFDICLSKKKLALKFGAVEVHPFKFVEVIRTKRKLFSK